MGDENFNPQFSLLGEGMGLCFPWKVPKHIRAEFGIQLPILPGVHPREMQGNAGSEHKEPGRLLTLTPLQPWGCSKAELPPPGYNPCDPLPWIHPWFHIISLFLKLCSFPASALGLCSKIPNLPPIPSTFRGREELKQYLASLLDPREWA